MIRTRGKLHLPRPRTNYYHSSFEFQGAFNYNKLPNNIRSMKSNSAFKVALLKLTLSVAKEYKFTLIW